jgi:hypothetical protein
MMMMLKMMVVVVAVMMMMAKMTTITIRCIVGCDDVVYDDIDAIAAHFSASGAAAMRGSTGNGGNKSNTPSPPRPFTTNCCASAPTLHCLYSCCLPTSCRPQMLRPCKSVAYLFQFCLVLICVRSGTTM